MLQVEQVERHVLADRQVVALARIMGGSEVDMPVVADVVAEFDDLLTAEPVASHDPSRLELLRLMGVA